MRSYADMRIQLARCKFFTVGPLHTVMSAILCRSKRPVGERLHSHRGIETNPANRSRIGSKFGWYGKVNQKSGRFSNVPFHSRINIEGRSNSGPLSGLPWFLRVHASAFHLLSPSILEKLSFPAEVPVFFFIFRHKLLNLNLSEPPNSFFEIILPITCCFFFNFFNHKLSPFRRWSMNVVNCLQIFCMHVCIFGRIKKLQILFLRCLKKS